MTYVQAAGGEIATTMVGLSRLGAKTVYVGAVSATIAKAISVCKLCAMKA